SSAAPVQCNPSTWSPPLAYSRGGALPRRPPPAHWCAANGCSPPQESLQRTVFVTVAPSCGRAPTSRSPAPGVSVLVPYREALRSAHEDAGATAAVGACSSWGSRVPNTAAGTAVVGGQRLERARQTRSTSATLQACAMQPWAVCGGSPPKI